MMRFIRPVSLTDAMLVASNVPETPPAAYAGGTTYGDGDTASTGTAGGIITVWESLQAGNIGHTPASSPTWWVEIGSTYAAWDSGTTYADAALVLSATTHRVYESVQASNTNHDPTTDDGTWWIDAGATNRWAMFDQTVGSVSSRSTPITVTIAPGNVEALALLDLAGSECTVSMVNDAVTVFSETVDLADASVLLDWWMYFFEPISPRTVAIIDGLPPFTDGQITISITGTGVLECGTLAVGALVELGEVLAGPGVGIIDYSYKATDAYGVTTVTERSYARKLDLQILMQAERVDYAVRQLAAIRATPVVWLADTIYESLILYGFYRDWGITISYPTHSLASLAVEGLT